MWGKKELLMYVSQLRPSRVIRSLLVSALINIHNYPLRDLFFGHDLNIFVLLAIISLFGMTSKHSPAWCSKHKKAVMHLTEKMHVLD